VPRYFFNLYNDVTAMDPEGMELPDLAAARAEAITNIRGLLTEDVLRGRIVLRHRIEIADESQAVVDKVAYGEAVEIER